MIHRMGYLVTLSLGTTPRIFIVRTIAHHIENIFLMRMLEGHLHGEYACPMHNIKIWIKKEMETSQVSHDCRLTSTASFCLHQGI